MTTSIIEGFSKDEIRSFRAALLNWFDSNGRVLPWRGIRDPYAIWISEIMLQQTTSAVGLSRWPRFFKRFPTVEDLANAPLEDVLHEWSGLGYYARARNLHRAAKTIEQEHGGKLPADFKTLKSLPGLGDYTAAAVASIAFDIPVPVLDANVERVMARLFAVEENPRAGHIRKEIGSLLNELIDQTRPGDFNEAMMDLGAMVCLPRDAKCTDCPERNLCRAHKQGVQEELPRLPKKEPMQQVREAAALLQDEKKRILVLRRRPEVSFGGMWELPRAVIADDEPAHEGARRALESATGLQAEMFELPSMKLRHTVMRRRIELNIFRPRYWTGDVKLAEHEEVKWVSPEEYHNMPKSTTHNKIARWLINGK